MLAELQSQHRQIARLKHEGYRATEISTLMEMPLTTVRNILADPLLKSHVASLEDASDKQVVDARKVLADGAVRAAEKVVSLIDSYDEKVGLSAARDVLDRSGYNPKQQFEHRHLHAHLSREDIEELKSRAKRAGALAEEAEEAEESQETQETKGSEAS